MISLFDQVRILQDDERPDLVGTVGRVLEQKSDGWWCVGLDDDDEVLREYPADALKVVALATAEWS